MILAAGAAQRVVVVAIIFLGGGVLFSVSDAFVDIGGGPRRPVRPTSYSSRNRFTIRKVMKEEMENVIEEDHEVDETIDSLRRMLVRQKSDIEATMKLITSLEEAKESDQQDEEDIENHHEIGTPIVMGFDYGFVSRSEGAEYTEINSEFKDLPGYENGPPANVWKLGWAQFWRNWDAMKGEYKDEPDMKLTQQQRELQAKLESLTLDSNEIWKREEETGIEGPWIIKAPYLLLCWLLDVVFDGKYVFSRFFLLETVARMPYFSYIGMLHLYETLGFWRRSADVKRIHFAEELNEFRHLTIAESLGGDQEWSVRFMAQHSAIVYYFVLCFLWLVSPSLSYEFSRLLETHAVHTYGQFLDENEEVLKTLPPSLKAVEYYVFGAADPFYAEFQISSTKGGEVRRPGESMRNLHDVYKAIQADEGDHVTAMKACLDPSVSLISPSIERRLLTAAAVVSTIGLLVNGVGSPTDVGVDSSAMEGLASDGIVETAVSGLAAALSQVFGGTTSEAVDGAEGAIEGAELFFESASLEKTISAIVGGVAWVLGTSSLTKDTKGGSGTENRDGDDPTEEDSTE